MILPLGSMQICNPVKLKFLYVFLLGVLVINWCSNTNHSRLVGSKVYFHVSILSSSLNLFSKVHKNYHCKLVPDKLCNPVKLIFYDFLISLFVINWLMFTFEIALQACRYTYVYVFMFLCFHVSMFSYLHQVWTCFPRYIKVADQVFIQLVRLAPAKFCNPVKWKFLSVCKQQMLNSRLVGRKS